MFFRMIICKLGNGFSPFFSGSEINIKCIYCIIIDKPQFLSEIMLIVVNFFYVMNCLFCLCRNDAFLHC